jgi:hypothetical protein
MDMSREIINTGTQGNDGTGDSIRDAFKKTNKNFIELYKLYGEDGSINITDLDDMPNSYDANQLLISNTAGNAFLAKTLFAGNNITIDQTDDTVVISASASGQNNLNRTVVDYTTPAIAFNVAHDANIDVALSYAVFSITANYACRLRIFGQLDGRTFGRNALVDVNITPTVSGTATTVFACPAVVCSNAESELTTDMYVSIVNLESSLGSIPITYSISVLPLDGSDI